MSPHTHLYCRRNGLTRTSCTSKGSAKSCNWGETILDTITHAGNHPARKQLCKTMTWGARIFPELPSDRTSGNGHRPKHRSCYLNIRKHFVTVRVMQHWQRLLRQIVESPPLEIKNVLTWSRANSSVWSYLTREAWARWPPEIPANFIHPVIMQWMSLTSILQKIKGLACSHMSGHQYKFYL